MRYLANAFSLQMLGGKDGTIFVRRLEADEVGRILRSGFASCVGHTDVARMIEKDTGVEIPVSRTNVTLDERDDVIVAQYVGPRLPEGATELPQGAKLQYFYVGWDHML